MNNYKKRLFSFLLMVTLVFSQGIVALAEPVQDNEEIVEDLTEDIGDEIIAPEESEDAENTEVDDISEKEDSSVITAFGSTDDIEINTEYKLALDSLKEMFPSSLEVIIEEEVVEVPVTWECQDNYDDYVARFTFIPVIEGYELVEDIVFPQLIVNVENYEQVRVAGYVEPEDKSIVESIGNGTVLYSTRTYYNAYEEGLLPAIRNQNPYGTCWAFSSVGAVESDLIKDNGADTSIDLSELQLVYFAYHNYNDPKNCHNDDTVTCSDYLENGGNSTFGYRSFANLVGPIDESILPYSRARENVIEDEYALSYRNIQLKNVYRINLEDRNLIKNQIIAHGGVSASYCSQSYIVNGEYYKAKYSATYNSFYGEVPITDHAVQIVGWDDEFPREHFSSDLLPDGDGAWLVRNSWGLDGYGERGYFWLSYYDKGLKSSGEVKVFDADYDTYENVYAYDRAHPTEYWYGLESETSVSQTFRVDAGESIEAVTFETKTPNVKVTASVTDGVNTVTGSINTVFGGFYTLVLDEPLVTTKVSDITAKLTYVSEDGDGVDVLFEYPGPRSYSNAYCNMAHGAVATAIVHSYGYSYDPGCDASIKLYTNSTDCVAPTVKSRSLSVAGRIGLNIDIDLSALTSKTLQNGYVAITGPNGTSTKPISNLGTTYDSNTGKTYHVVTIDSLPREIDDEYEIHLYNESRNPIAFSNANMADGSGYKCSVNDYISQMVGKESYASIWNLASAIECVGQYAKAYFGVSSQADAQTMAKSIIGDANFANISQKASLLNESSISKYKKVVSDTSAGLDYVGSSLVLLEGTSIRHYFKPADGVDIAGYTFMIGGKRYYPTKKGNYYYIEILNISPADYDQDYAVSASKSGEYLDIHYSVNSYIYDVLSKSQDSDLGTLGKYMYLQGVEANEYFK